MAEIKQVTGTGIPLLLDDIDTDRIIPARFLRCVTFDGLGEHAFEDDRAQNPNHPFGNPEYQSGVILIAGRNFGCGSSREHAPQSLMRWGVQTVVAESFAEIFFGNCTALGIPAVCASRDTLKTVNDAVIADPNAELTVDLEQLEIRCGGQSYPVTLAEGARRALVSGNYDFMAQLLEAKDEIAATSAKVPYMNAFAESAAS